ncbi:acyltransferase family protein [Ligilactobacillus equi]|uniref:acyltransferase family protein n=1 Tax=Ligilactobacillus equi TaxID=137357 RepID=UPI002ECFBF9E
MSKKRVEWIDLSRAIGMLLIICNHSVGGSYGSGFIGKFCFAVSVPIFFVLSGYLFKEKKFAEVVKGGFLNLLLPYIVTVFMLWVVRSLHIVFPSWVVEQGSSFSLAVAYGLGTATNLPNGIVIPAIGAIWFLLAMFVGNILFQLGIKLQNIVNRKATLEAYVITLLIVGYWTGEYIKLPWSINAAMVSQVFYYFGYIIKKYNLLKKERLSLTLIGLLFWVVSAMSGYLYLNVPFANNVFLALLGGIGGSYTIISISKLITDNVSVKAMCYYGKMSLIVLSVHLIESDSLKFGMLISQAVNNILHNELLAIYGVLLYRICLTAIAVMVIPKIPVLRSFYLNRQYPFFKRLKVKE